VGSPFAPVVLSVAALIAALVRWQLQGGHGLYTAVSKRLYVPDPDLGWQVSPMHPLWIGLDLCAAIAALAVALVIAGWWIRRREARLGQRATALRRATWVLGAVPLALPILAFASGGGPPNAVATLPESTIQGIEAGIVGIIDAPAGRYEVVAHPGTSITARVSAGHETFDARFGGGIHGSWQGDPHDFTRPLVAEISVDAASVDTDNNLRSTHAREEYLLAGKFPKIALALDRVIAANQAGAGAIKFRAHGTLSLIGQTHSVEVTGTLKKPDAAALARLNLKELGADVLLVQAEFPVVIKETALAQDAHDFDGDQIPIQVSLVMRHTSG
jgi:polyisoprenoid-binding protein YceI